MILNEKLTKALNDQVNAEYYSAYLYLTMSAFAECSAYKGAAKWLFAQAKEEMTHGTRIYQYILERGASPSFAGIPLPPVSFTGMKDIFEQVLAHEKKVSESLNKIATLAMQENDHACYQFMMWFVNEQVEEEANAADITGKIQLADGNKSLLLFIDNKLGERD